ncbi:hypothetical protein BCV69DRAFT_47789 [Microstroma glucosiphilum]|uniref:Uncharacterized protein n=1 Tax=Pseudomicrostroma glucosiphilum TaxID=1684307 RepID=A0A316U1G0_9BASI|nr:hypothetical protein BCV69DRAFT_47789 [Pseudomicrostroma glucosiphilum]PWN19212.1 hypothetical protein BCV69DRAFT_47789 [Pseudomicrostroma glucosiphilum]
MRLDDRGPCRRPPRHTPHFRVSFNSPVRVISRAQAPPPSRSRTHTFTQNVHSNGQDPIACEKVTTAILLFCLRSW